MGTSQCSVEQLHCIHLHKHVLHWNKRELAEFCMRHVIGTWITWSIMRDTNTGHIFGASTSTTLRADVCRRRLVTSAETTWRGHQELQRGGYSGSRVCCFAERRNNSASLFLSSSSLILASMEIFNKDATVVSPCTPTNPSDWWCDARECLQSKGAPASTQTPATQDLPRHLAASPREVCRLSPWRKVLLVHLSLSCPVGLQSPWGVVRRHLHRLRRVVESGGPCADEQRRVQLSWPARRARQVRKTKSFVDDSVRPFDPRAPAAHVVNIHSHANQCLTLSTGPEDVTLRG